VITQECDRDYWGVTVALDVAKLHVGFLFLHPKQHHDW